VGEYLGEDLLLTLSHRQFVWTIPKDLRVFLHHDRELFADLGRLLAKVHELDIISCSPPHRAILSRQQCVHPGALRVRTEADGIPRGGDDVFDRDNSFARMDSESLEGRLNRHAKQRAARTTTRCTIILSINSYGPRPVAREQCS
jgi:hypothetical protein